MQDFEKLGVFYLGREYDLTTKQSNEDLILYDSKDLVTHAVCVGMTGSGKTGLCISILEEAAIDGIPAIIIDPKGDLANLMLTFPQLRPDDFAPWVDEDDARKKGLSVEQYAAEQAEVWRNGLAKWGQDGARIQRLRDAADVAIYTPGSNAGIGVSILKSFATPEQAIRDDGELFRERVATTVTSLLGLLGIDADPIQSREHILLSKIFGSAWQQGNDLDLATLIQRIQEPGVQRIGVLDLESFYASKDRFALAMRLNNLLAAPGFGAWMEGEALDIGAMLHSRSGKPRHAIFSIAHLGDAERMFFVSMLLNQVLGWMRQQPGATSLRAIVYMDEIFGYFPPTANPPSKQPLLTLMKQGRAFGVGVMLATQNPVDLDYKGLSNAGTWFIGRLQTDRDKQRLLDGLEGAGAGASAKFDRAAMEQTMAGLGNRVFLMNNVHEDKPVIFESRWAMSYLRGPMTREQIRTVMGGVITSSNAGNIEETTATNSSAKAQAANPALASSRSIATDAVKNLSIRPVFAPEITQLFVPIRKNPAAGATLVYR
ncbi:MAG: ATP-binding protein, partial [Chthoniobacterales bacterium]|nr:ATP-binding protein [Chthoniobacterales bacterium]